MMKDGSKPNFILLGLFMGMMIGLLLFGLFLLILNILKLFLQ